MTIRALRKYWSEMESPTIVTSLYDLIAGIHESIPQENDELVTDIVFDLIKNRSIRKVQAGEQPEIYHNRS